MLNLEIANKLSEILTSESKSKIISFSSTIYPSGIEEIEFVFEQSYEKLNLFLDIDKNYQRGIIFGSGKQSLSCSLCDGEFEVIKELSEITNILFIDHLNRLDNYFSGIVYIIADELNDEIKDKVMKKDLAILEIEGCHTLALQPSMQVHLSDNESKEKLKNYIKEYNGDIDKIFSIGNAIFKIEFLTREEEK